MATRKPQFPKKPNKDIPEVMLASALKRLRLGKVRRSEWNSLVGDPEQANLVRFIEATSYMLSPDNPELRGRVSQVLMTMHYLEDSSRLVAELTESWEKSTQGILSSETTST